MLRDIALFAFFSLACFSTTPKGSPSHPQPTPAPQATTQPQTAPTPTPPPIAQQEPENITAEPPLVENIPDNTPQPTPAPTKPVVKVRDTRRKTTDLCNPKKLGLSGKPAALKDLFVPYEYSFPYASPEGWTMDDLLYRSEGARIDSEKLPKGVKKLRFFDDAYWATGKNISKLFSLEIEPQTPGYEGILFVIESSPNSTQFVAFGQDDGATLTLVLSESSACRGARLPPSKISIFGYEIPKGRKIQFKFCAEKREPCGLVP